MKSNVSALASRSSTRIDSLPSPLSLPQIHTPQANSDSAKNPLHGENKRGNSLIITLLVTWDSVYVIVIYGTGAGLVGSYISRVPASCNKSALFLSPTVLALSLIVV